MFCVWVAVFINGFVRAPKNRLCRKVHPWLCSLCKTQHDFEWLFPLLCKAMMTVRMPQGWHEEDQVRSGTGLGTQHEAWAHLSVTPHGRVVAWYQLSLPSAHQLSLAHFNCSFGIPAFPCLPAAFSHTSSTCARWRWSRDVYCLEKALVR